jgi:AAA domain
MLKLALEPLDGSSLVETRYLRMLVMGFVGIGKTTSVVSTCPKPAYVINSDRDNALNPAVDHMLGKGRAVSGAFKHNLIQSDGDMEEAIKLARHLVLKENYKTVIWDTCTGFAPHLLLQCENQGRTANGKLDGRKHWPEFFKRLMNTGNRLIKIPAHVIVCSHWEHASSKSEDDDDDDKERIPKTGDGIVPGLPGKARMHFGKLFEDVVFLEKTLDGSRVFTTDIEGVWGPKSSSLPGVKQTPADIGKFLKMKEERMALLKKNLHGGAPIASASVKSKKT